MAIRGGDTRPIRFDPPKVLTPDPPAAAGGLSYAPWGASGGGIPVPIGSFMPPNGFAGFAQQTSAVQSLYRRGKAAAGGSRRRRKKAAKKKAAPRRKARRVVAKGARKGSAAMKRKMARLRKMRRK